MGSQLITILARRPRDPADKLTHSARFKLTCQALSISLAPSYFLAVVTFMSDKHATLNLTHEDGTEQAIDLSVHSG